MELIVAVDQHGSIGDSTTGKMLWDVPEDLDNFRIITSGNIVVMGRKTFDSLKRPLKNRVNIVLTRQLASIANEEMARDCANNQVFYTDLSDLFDIIRAIRMPNQKVFVIGGAEIYRLLFRYVNVIHLTIITHPGPKGDVIFPDEIIDEMSDKNNFVAVDYGEVRESRNRPNKYEFITLQRKQFKQYAEL